MPFPLVQINFPGPERSAGSWVAILHMGPRIMNDPWNTENSFPTENGSFRRWILYHYIPAKLPLLPKLDQSQASPPPPPDLQEFPNSVRKVGRSLHLWFVRSNPLANKSHWKLKMKCIVKLFYQINLSSFNILQPLPEVIFKANLCFDQFCLPWHPPFLA